MRRPRARAKPLGLPVVQRLLPIGERQREPVGSAGESAIMPGVLYRWLNATRNDALVADKAEKASSWGARAKGLLGRDGLEPGGGLLIEPCNSIHMFFMRFTIDVLFLDAELRVVRAISGIRPWRLTRVYPRAQSALELPEGTVLRTQTAAGDQLRCEVAVPQCGMP